MAGPLFYNLPGTLWVSRFLTLQAIRVCPCLEQGAGECWGESFRLTKKI